MFPSLAFTGISPLLSLSLNLPMMWLLHVADRAEMIARTLG